MSALKQYKTFPASSPVAGYDYDSKAQVLHVHYVWGLLRGTYHYYGVDRDNVKGFLGVKPAKRYKYMKQILGRHFCYTYTPLPNRMPDP